MERAGVGHATRLDPPFVRFRVQFTCVNRLARIIRRHSVIDDAAEPAVRLIQRQVLEFLSVDEDRAGVIHRKVETPSDGCGDRLRRARQGEQAEKKCKFQGIHI